MREGITWFFVGATVMGLFVGLVWRQQAQLDRRLVAVEAPAPTAGQRRAAETGSGLVQRAISAGIWTRQDAAEFSALDEMGGEARLELQRQLAVAINEDRVRVEPGAEFRW